MEQEKTVSEKTVQEKINVAFGARQVVVELSQAAVRELARRSMPLMVEMELYFSCLIRKKVRFYQDAGIGEFIRATDKLSVGFRPVMTQQCSVHDTVGAPPLTDFEIKNPAHFIPHWLRIDFRKGEWRGEFGYG
jgi:hypothetical protein